MSESRQRRILLIGGHLDGRWVDVPKPEFTYRAPKPMHLDVAAWLKQGAQADVSVPMLEFVEYRLERMPIAIRTANAVVWIGVASDLFGPERDRAIVRALFQRDVAQLFQEAP
jgi:hypothetical protein